MILLVSFVLLCVLRVPKRFGHEEHKETRRPLRKGPAFYEKIPYLVERKL